MVVDGYYLRGALDSDTSLDMHMMFWKHFSTPTHLSFIYILFSLLLTFPTHFTIIHLYKQNLSFFFFSAPFSLYLSTFRNPEGIFYKIKGEKHENLHKIRIWITYSGPLYSDACILCTAQN